MTRWIKNANIFQIAKVSGLNFCLTFCQFQPGVTYKSVAYRKVCIAFKSPKKSIFKDFTEKYTQNFLN